LRTTAAAFPAAAAGDSWQLVAPLSAADSAVRPAASWARVGVERLRGRFRVRACRDALGLRLGGGETVQVALLDLRPEDAALPVDREHLRGEEVAERWRARMVGAAAAGNRGEQLAYGVERCACPHRRTAVAGEPLHAGAGDNDDRVGRVQPGAGAGRRERRHGRERAHAERDQHASWAGGGLHSTQVHPRLAG
jgi:hypothetical protein